MFQLTMLLPDYMIVSLIKSFLPLDCFSETRVQQIVYNYMHLNTAYAGIYVNVLTCSTKTYEFKPGALAGPVQSGKWITSLEVEQLLERVDKYLAIKPHHEKENTDIDNHWRSWATKSHNMDRKSKDNPRKWVKWQKNIRDQYCTNIAPQDANKDFVPCPRDVGWSENMQKRCKAHVKDAPATAIFGVLNAPTHLVFANRPDIVLEPFTLFASPHF